MGLATYTYNRSTSGGEIITHLVNSSDGQGLDFANGALLQLEYAAGGVFGTSDFSIEFIIDQSSGNSNNKILYTSGGNNEFQITSETASSKIELTFDGADYDFSYDMSADYGSPVHYVMTFDRSALATLYKDGNSVATVDISGSSAVDLDNSGTADGYLGGVSDYGVTGVFYRWRTWKKLLSAAEVTACYENASVPIADQWSNCVTDLDFAFANPEMSLQIQSRSGAGDATASVGISQITPIEQVNTNKLNVGGTTPLVGIGLPAGTTPGYPLEIRTNASGTDPQIIIRDIGTNDAAIGFQSTTDPYTWAIGADTNDGAKFKIAKGHDLGTNTALTINSAGLTTVTNPGWPLKNEISNSGFDVWSNSGLSSGRTIGRQSDDFNVGSAILDNDGSAIGSWNGTTSRCAVTVSGGEFIMTDDGTGSDMRTEVQLSGLTAGKLYKFSVQLENGTGTWGAATNAYVRVWNSAKSATLATAPTQTEASGMEDYSVIWEASSATDWIILSAEVSAGQTVKFDNVYVTEVTPGIVTATLPAMDGWEKTNLTTVKLYREHQGSNTKDGSFYSAKLVNTRTAAGGIYWQTQAGTDRGNLIPRFAGRTVTFGAWLKQDTADEVKLAIADSDGETASSVAAATGSFVWHEVTRPIGTSITTFKVYITTAGGAATTVSYFSQPMLVFGSAIGAGNYSRPSGEIVYCETAIGSNKFDANTGFADIATTTMNAEADSNGKIPKGAKAIMFKLSGEDSGSSGADVAFQTGGLSSLIGMTNDISGTPNGVRKMDSGWTPCDANGDYDYYLSASGGATGTFDFYYGYKYIGVQLR